jgi:hypothetical protein
MTKLKLGLAAGVAAILAFGVAACGQTTPATEEAPAVEESAVPAEAPPAEAVEPAADAAAPPAEAPPAETKAP